MSNTWTTARVVRIGLAAVFGFAAASVVSIYATKPRPGNGEGEAASKLDAEQAPSGIGTFVAKATPEPMPAASFINGNGATVSLDDWRGKVVLLNLWATWCVPCRKEMPALDRLQGALGSSDFEVVALSIDRAGAAGARRFLDSIGIKNLKLYADPTAKLANTFRAPGLPMTMLIDRHGREAGRLIGPAEWDSAEAQALITKALAAK